MAVAVVMCRDNTAESLAGQREGYDAWFFNIRGRGIKGK